MGPTSPIRGAASPSDSLCGVWVDHDGAVRTTVAAPDGKREERRESLRPFRLDFQVCRLRLLRSVTIETLNGEGAYRRLAQCGHLRAITTRFFAAPDGAGIDVIPAGRWRASSFCRAGPAFIGT